MRERLFRVISSMLDVPIEKINEDLSSETVKGWDSFQHMNLIIALEEEFGVQFADDKIGELMKVSSIINEIELILGSSS